MQAFGPNVVTGHGPCKERVLLGRETAGFSSQQLKKMQHCLRGLKKEHQFTI